MRTRSEEKRREILRAAESLFVEVGFERTSMSMIAERMRGSKQTLYNYFQSKEELLRAVLDYDVGEVADRAMQDFLAAKNLRVALVRLGVAYLSGQLAPSAMANIRIVATQPAESDLGEHFYKNVLCPAWERVREAFKCLMDEGRLKRADPWVAAMHWKGLVLFDLFEKRLLGAMKSIDPKEVEAAAKHAADAFLKIYGSDAPTPTAKQRS